MSCEVSFQTSVCLAQAEYHAYVAHIPLICRSVAHVYPIVNWLTSRGCALKAIGNLLEPVWQIGEGILEL